MISSFFSWWTIKTLTANQNPPDFKCMLFKVADNITAAHYSNLSSYCSKCERAFSLDLNSGPFIIKMTYHKCLKTVYFSLLNISYLKPNEPVLLPVSPQEKTNKKTSMASCLKRKMILVLNRSITTEQKWKGHWHRWSSLIRVWS